MVNLTDQRLRVIILIMGLAGLGNSAGRGLTLSQGWHLQVSMHMVHHATGNRQQATVIHFDDGCVRIRIHRFISLNSELLDS
jgi:hypothetical protein